MNNGSKEPHQVDVHVGKMVRLFRNMAGVTQTGLADSLGLTFQQVQKYEKGSNRVSASKLYDISRLLERDIAEFFEGVEEGTVVSFSGGSVDSGRELTALLSSREGLRLNRAFVQIEDKNVRSKVIALVEGLIGINNTED